MVINRKAPSGRCPVCRGSGRQADGKKCPACDGKGELNRRKT